MSDKDVDAQFADIVAHWDDVAAVPQDHAGADTAEHAVVDGPDEAPSESPPAPPLPPADSPHAPAAHGVNPAFDGFVVWRGATPTPPPDDQDGLDQPRELAAAHDDDDHFHPGPTAPLPPQEDLHFWGIVVGLVAGPLLLLWLVIVHPAVSGWWTLGALALTIGGFVLLVMRQPHSADGDDPDDGARI
jgi:hypothetical protein